MEFLAKGIKNFLPPPAHCKIAAKIRKRPQ
jgi:hypothetical protein